MRSKFLAKKSTFSPLKQVLPDVVREVMNILTLSVRSFFLTHMFKTHPGVFGFSQVLTRTLSFHRK